MLRKGNIGWISFVLSLITGYQLSSQAIQQVLPPTSGESIVLQSDRSMYVTSENLYYTAYCQKPPQISELEWSSVLYVELISWNGAKLAQTISPIEGGVAEGSMQIPKNVLSGNYYLRAYSKWMRNYSPYTYTYLPVKVINPYSPSVDKGPEIDEPPALSKVGALSEFSKEILISDLQETYGKRQLVEFELSLLDIKFTGIYSLSVAKQGRLDSLRNSFRFTNTNQTERSRKIEYLPEIDGLTISGKIINTRSGEPVSDMKINLSSYSGSFYFFSTTSDKDGSFVFVLPNYEGKYEFHVVKESHTNDEYQILLANEFCHQPVALPYVAFLLEDQERLSAEEMLRNAQLSNKYAHVDSTFQKENNVHAAFYGLPGSIIYEKDFIELDNMEEFFYEVVHNVVVGTRKQEPYLIVNGPSSLVAYPPLILMDNIPVTNIQNLLETSCRRINRVEVVDKGYVIGNFKYKGIISVFSEKKDMAGIELTGDSHFFSYQLFTDSEHSFPDYSESTGRSNIADRRNLLHWEPQLQLSGQETVKVSFYTSDAPGNYMVYLRGLHPDGLSAIYGKSGFIVK